MNAIIDLAPDFKEAEKMLDALDFAGEFTFQTFDDSEEKRKSLVQISHGSLMDNRDQLKALNNKGAGIFVTINKTDLKGRKASNVTQVRAVFVDFDLARPERVAELNALPLPPTVIVESSPGKHHAYWISESGEIPLSGFRDLQQKLIKFYMADGADKSVHDLPRVLRLPGYWHRKETPFKTRVLQIGEYYTAQQIIDWVNSLPIEEKPLELSVPQSDNSDPFRDAVNVSDEDRYRKYLQDIASCDYHRNNLLYKNADHVLALAKEKRVKASFEQAKQDLINAGIMSGLTFEESQKTVESASKSTIVLQASPERYQQDVEAYRKQQILKEFEALPGSRTWVDVKKSGKPKDTLDNLKVLLWNYGITSRYNVVKKADEHHIKNLVCSMDNRDSSAFSEIISLCKRHDLPTENTRLYLSRIADENQYNPALTWISSRAWDGQDRLTDFLKTVKVADPRMLTSGEPFHEHLIKKWLIQAVAACVEPKISAAGVLVFQGDQGIGKTSWFKKLVPSSFENDLTKSDSFLNPHDKDSILSNITYWLVELGELNSTFSRADIQALKSFITRDFDELRKPYAASSSYFGRRTVFFASVNDGNFLQDETGNRRYWTIPTASINYDHDFDMQQVWAQVLTLYQQGETFRLGKEASDLLNQVNDSHMAIDPVIEKLEATIEWGCKDLSRYNKYTATEIYMHLFNGKPTRRDSNSISAYLKKRGFEPVNNAGKRFTIPPYKGEEPIFL